jgi:hypothetical protein
MEILKKNLNPKWGISINLGHIIRCISKIRGGGGRIPSKLDSRREIQARGDRGRDRAGSTVWRKSSVKEEDRKGRKEEERCG